MSHVKRWVVLVVMAAMLAGPLGPAALAATDDAKKAGPSPASMVVDLFAARPLGFAATVFGTATFLLALPFSELGNNTQQSFDLLIAPAAKYTFKRPLGDFR
jgi:hypothetical protein